MNASFSLPPAIALIGPTASGKTDLSLEIAEWTPVEIISLDSALVYQDMNIGTAKPEATTLAQVPHHLIDIITPLESYSAADCREDVVRLMTEITERDRTPLIVGGTMLYFHALLNGLNALPKADPATRARIDQEAAEAGWPALHRQLQAMDPETASRLSPNDSQRIQRAIEVFRLTGKPMSQWLAQPQDTALPCELHSIALMAEDRPALHQRIHQRFEAMIAAGLVDEVIGLKEKYPALHLGLPSMRSVGYRQVWEHLEGQYDQERLVEKAKAATRQLCKRQLTWLRSLPVQARIDAFDPQLKAQLKSQVLAFLNSVGQ